MTTSTTMIHSFAPQDRVVPVLLERQAARFGDRPLFVAGSVRWTYRDAVEAAAGYGAALLDAGIRAGDRVALMCSNRVEFLQTFLGCAWISAVAVPINTASRGVQLRHILSNSGARLLVVEADYLEAVRALDAAELPMQQTWLVGDAFPKPGTPVEKAAIRPGDTLAILYTSGTTGLSKGVCCPHAQYYWWGVHSSELLGLQEGEILLTTLPQFHTNALNAFFQALLTGSTLVVEKRFSASAFWRSLVEHRATVTYLLGAMVPILLSKDRTPQDKAHGVRVALAPGVPPQFHAEFHERFGMHLLEGYGSTETNFVIGADLSSQRPATMGKVRAGFEARVGHDH